MAQNSCLDDKLSLIVIEEAEVVWKTDLDLLPNRDYIKSYKRSWQVPPPEINDEEFKEFGLKIISLIEEEILRLWILNRSELFAMLKENFYPRPLEDRDDQHKLIMKIAKDKKELRWAAVWLIWKKIGGLLEKKEEEFFNEEIDESIPAEYQELQKINRKESEDFLKGKTYMRIRITELGNENLNTIKWLGKNNAMISMAISAIKLLNKDITNLKVELEKKIQGLIDEENVLKKRWDDLNEKKNEKDLIKELKIRLENLEKELTQVGSLKNILHRKDINKDRLVIKKLDFLTRSQKRIESKVNSWNYDNLNLVKKKKQDARKFYELIQKNKKSKEKKLNAVKEEELSDKENFSLEPNSLIYL